MNAASARMLHGALVGSVFVLVLALVLVRQFVGLRGVGVDLPLAALRIAVFTLMLGTLLIQRILRAGLPDVRSATDAAEWWRSHGGRVLTIWALTDALATAGAVFWFLTGDIVVLAIGTGVGLFLLMMARPEGFTGG
jgi:hypothetical protein